MRRILGSWLRRWGVWCQGSKPSTLSRIRRQHTPPSSDPPFAGSPTYGIPILTHPITDPSNTRSPPQPTPSQAHPTPEPLLLNRPHHTPILTHHSPRSSICTCMRILDQATGHAFIVFQHVEDRDKFMRATRHPRQRRAWRLSRSDVKVGRSGVCPTSSCPCSSLCHTTTSHPMPPHPPSHLTKAHTTTDAATNLCGVHSK